MFNVIIVGGDNVEDKKKFFTKCVYYLKPKVESGEQIRILTIGEESVLMFAQKAHIETKQYICDWKKYGNGAINQRNREIMKDADAIIYFGTSNKDLDYLYNYAKIKNKLMRRALES